VDQLLTVYPFDDLVEMSEILLTLPPDADEWVSRSDRSVAVLKHRGNLLNSLIAKRPRAAADAWISVKARLQATLPTWDFHKWFVSTQQLQISMDGQFLFVSVEDAAHRQWIHNHFRQQVMVAAAEAGVQQRLVFWPSSKGAPPNCVATTAMMHLQPIDETG